MRTQACRLAVPVDCVPLDPAKVAFFPGAGPGSDVTAGMLFSGPDEYDVVELDVDGGPKSFSTFRQPGTARLRRRDNVDRHAGGLWFALVALGRFLVCAVRACDAGSSALSIRPPANNADIITGPAVTLHADQVTRGFRVDVWASMTGLWLR